MSTKFPLPTAYPSASSDIHQTNEKIGRIIIANLLSLPVRRYRHYVKQVTENPLCHTLLGDGIIERRRLPGAIFSRCYPERGRDAVACLQRKNGHVSCLYTAKEFTWDYLVTESPETIRSAFNLDDQQVGLLWKLRRISTRNRITHTILQALCEIRFPCLLNNIDPQATTYGLPPFRQIDLVTHLQTKDEHGDLIDRSRVSRLVRNCAVILPNGNRISLAEIFLTPAAYCRSLIGEIIAHEQEYLAKGTMQVPYNDNVIRNILAGSHDVRISTRSVCAHRTALGIPSARFRLYGENYPPVAIPLSNGVELSVDKLRSVPACSGIYELSLAEGMLDYPKGKSAVFYVGSAKNIRKRLQDHLRAPVSRSTASAFIRKYNVHFRYAFFPDGWKGGEKELYHCFVDTYGAPPLCNKVSP